MLLILLMSCADDGTCRDGFVLRGGYHCDPAGAGDTALLDTAAPDDTGGDGGTDGGTDGGGDGGGDSGGSTSGPSLVYGDPITPINVVEPETSNGGFYEFTDGVMISDTLAMMVGQGGYVVIDAVTGEEVQQYDADRTYRVDIDRTRGVAWATTRDRGVMAVDVSDPLALEPLGLIWNNGLDYTEDVAVEDGVMLLAAQEQGVVIAEYDDTGWVEELTRLPAEFAFSVAIHGDRALYTDNNWLVLLDISAPGAPSELYRLELDGEGRDIDFDGQQASVALGGDGVALVDLLDDTLVERAELEMPGSTFSTTLDGDYLWAAAWDAVAVAWIGEGEPVVLGHELNEQYALGVAAGGGRAVIADWLVASTMHLNPGMAGPEIEVDDSVAFSTEGGTVPVTFKNAGAMDLEVSVDALDGSSGFTAEAESFTLAPGDAHAVLVESDPGSWSINLRYTSNDPDELTGDVNLTSQVTSIGEEHPEMVLWGFEYPDTELTQYDLSAHRGQVVLLVYFATF